MEHEGKYVAPSLSTLRNIFKGHYDVEIKYYSEGAHG